MRYFYVEPQLAGHLGKNTIISDGRKLVMSERALDLLRGLQLHHALIAPFNDHA